MEELLLLDSISIMRRRAHAVLCGATCLFAIAAYGQGAPSQIEVEEQRRRAREVIEEREQRQREPDIRLQAPAEAAPRQLPAETPCFPLRELVFEVPAELAANFRELQLTGPVLTPCNSLVTCVFPQVDSVQPIPSNRSQAPSQNGEVEVRPRLSQTDQFALTDLEFSQNERFIFLLFEV